MLNAHKFPICPMHWPAKSETSVPAFASVIAHGSGVTDRSTHIVTEYCPAEPPLMDMILRGAPCATGYWLVPTLSGMLMMLCVCVFMFLTSHLLQQTAGVRFFLFWLLSSPLAVEFCVRPTDHPFRRSYRSYLFSPCLCVSLVVGTHSGCHSAFGFQRSIAPRFRPFYGEA